MAIRRGGILDRERPEPLPGPEVLRGDSAAAVRAVEEPGQRSLGRRRAGRRACRAARPHPPGRPLVAAGDAYGGLLGQRPHGVTTPQVPALPAGAPVRATARAGPVRLAHVAWDAIVRRAIYRFRADLDRPRARW